MPGATACRHCGAPLELTVVDLGKSPLCQTVLTTEQLEQAEAFYPLHVARLQAVLARPDPGVRAARGHLHRVRVLLRVLRLVGRARAALRRDDRPSVSASDRTSLVVELASNDGYLLQHFLAARHPGARHRAGAERRGGGGRARRRRRSPSSSAPSSARRLAGGAAAPPISCSATTSSRRCPTSTTSSPASRAARAGGDGDVRVPAPRELIEHLEYDTIYHEHFSYFSLHSIRAIFGAQGLALVDVEELPSHGGSLRVFLAARRGRRRSASPAVADAARRARTTQGLRDPETYERFADGVRESKRALLELLIGLRREGKQVVGYGAPGKGNTLLNYCGIRTDFLDYTVDRNPYKQGKHTPGTHIPIHAPERIAETRPDVIVILPWNLAPRDQRAARLHGGVGREARRPDPDGDDVRAGHAARGGAASMKVVIFCGGLGVRMGEETQRIPKPMIRIGNRPILWHIMRYYAAWGHTEFVLCLGYKGDVDPGVLPQLQRGAVQRLRPRGARRRRPRRAAEARRRRLADHVRRHRDAVDDRRAAEGGRARTSTTTMSSSRRTATASPTRRSTEMIDSFRASGRLIQFLSVRPAVQRAPRDHGRATGRHVGRGHEPLGRADQRRLLRVPARAARLDRAGRRARRGDVRAPDPARRGGRVPVRGLLRADGHDQGPAAARGAPRVRPRTLAAGRAARRNASRGRPDARALALAAARRRCAACSRSAAMPTTSRSAAAGRSSRSRASASGPRGDVGRARRATGARAAEARASAEDVPRGRRRAPRSSSTGSGTRSCRTTARRSRRRSRSSSAVEPDLVLTHTRDDLHQDHRLACELTWNTFRDHLILEYEVPKWDGDLGRPNLYVPLDDDVVERQARARPPALPDPGGEALVRRRRRSAG